MKRIETPEKQIRAVYNEKTIRVYQAFNKKIANEAVQEQTFGSKFKKDRMTWIKPSFMWMMYRSGWAQKTNQEHILAIDITLDGFLHALENSTLSSFNPTNHQSHEIWQALLQQYSGRIQWDPERNYRFKPLPYRSIQIGLSPSLVNQYLSTWIIKIADITELVHTIYHEIELYGGNHPKLPYEIPFPIISDSIKQRLF